MSSPRRTRRRIGDKGVAPYLLLLPAVALFVAFFAVPLGYTVYLSLQRRKVSGLGLGQAREVFVGLDNYVSVATDAEFWESVRRMAIYGVIVVAVMVLLALLFALMLDNPAARLKSFSRLSLFIPYAVPGVIATVIWGFLYLPDVSPIRATAAAVGLPEPNFFGGHSIYGSLANIGIWTGVGFNTIVLFTGLRSVSPEVYEAARVDGASQWQIARFIKIPLLVPTIAMISIFSVIGALQVFTEPTTLQPLTNQITTGWMPLMKVYEDTFTNVDLYTSAAESVLLAGGTLVLSLIGLRLLQSRVFGSQR